ncbi:serine kinase [Altererythrobacter aerius]|uniref:Serine kinase n=1 Tax=Tsuneonella aeria TaxID=1837929 RepID=A0A6I4TBU7_9SPHN|nr:HPr kinase/phosphatase C-terminal domain-containing protein [Tsuneonella aeria]MXO74523.1 serine kinase [Tsuneonella aeria]
MNLRQFTAVAIGGRALLLDGPPGAGKSTLALQLIDRGAVLVGDDGIAIERRGDAVWAAPPPATRGLLELRGIGIASLPACEAPVALILRLGIDGPRLVERAEMAGIEGVPIPALPFDAHHSAAALRAEHALAMHGLPRYAPR